MFIFSRHRSGATELYSILGKPADFEDGDKRFGKPVVINHWKEEFYDIGTMILIQKDDGIELLIAGNGVLTEDESLTLMKETEILTGYSTWRIGNEPKAGWSFHEELH